MAEGSKPPKGKVKPKTPVPLPDQPGDPGRPRRALLGRTVVVLGPVLALLVAIGLGVFLGVRASRSPDDVATPPTPTTETTETAPTPTRTTPASAKDLFAETCASCHTLAAADAFGGIGPNLDEAKPTLERVRTQIANGSLSGAMPAKLLTGDEAERVAVYVAATAGKGG